LTNAKRGREEGEKERERKRNAAELVGVVKFVKLSFVGR